MSPWLPQSHEPVSLRRLFPHASFVGCADIRVMQVCEHSDRCTPRSLFAALPGTRQSGSRFAADAVARGAESVLTETPLPDVSVPQCVVPNVRAAYARLCEAVEQYPSERLTVAGVTGTNGKTTTTYLIRSILTAAGRPTGLLGTVEYHDGIEREKSTLTTPDSQALARWLARMVDNGMTHATLELSSHALDQRRAAGTLLDAAVVTNITQDHFDYHENFTSYLKAKANIFRQIKPGGTVVLNADDPGSASFEALLGQFPPADRRPVMTYGLDEPADVTATILQETLWGSRFRLRVGRGTDAETDAETVEVNTGLVGRHNVSNCLAAAATCAALGVGLVDIATGIETLAAVPGRLERADGPVGVPVFVDYAHTDDALRRCVRSLKEHTQGRLICVFGAGGDRDRSKRPLLGRAAAEADLAVVTSDNPRSEDPRRIIEDILEGLQTGQQADRSSHCAVHVEPDRTEGIRWALAQARPGDTVLIAGKGHETEQIIGETRLRFDDREVVRQILSTANTSTANTSVSTGRRRHVPAA